MDGFEAKKKHFYSLICSSNCSLVHLLFFLFLFCFYREGNGLRGRVEEGDKSSFFFQQLSKIVHNSPYFIIKCFLPNDDYGFIAERCKNGT